MADDTDVSTGEDSVTSQGETTDVETTTAEETATTASGDEKTPDADTSTEVDADGQKVPYNRFKEVNEAKIVAEAKSKELQTKLTELEKGKSGQQATQNLTPAQQAQVGAVKEQLKALGFVTVEDQQKTIQQEREDLDLRREIDTLTTRYDGKDGKPKFEREQILDYALKNKVGNLEAAYKLMNEKKLTDWHIKQVAGKTKGIKTEASTGTGQTTAGTSDDDLTKAAGKGDKGALHTFLKRRASFAQGRK